MSAQLMQVAVAAQLMQTAMAAVAAQLMQPSPNAAVVAPVVAPVVARSPAATAVEVMHLVELIQLVQPNAFVYANPSPQ